MHNILIIAEKEPIGAFLKKLLQKHCYHAILVESRSGLSGIVGRLTRQKIDLLIATNTSLTPVVIQDIVPEIKARLPDTRIIILSGYAPQDFITDLMQSGIDKFLPIPFENQALLKEIEKLLSPPTR